MVENSKIGRIIFLGFGAAQDIKYQKISTEYLLAGSCAAILYRALFGRMHWSVWVAGLGCGIVFLMISKWSQEGIGYGDSWMILNMGIFLGIWNLLGMLMLAFLWLRWQQEQVFGAENGNGRQECHFILFF